MREPFGTTAEGKAVEKITLSAGDLTVSILTWGAVVQDVRLKGVAYPLTLGSNDLADYEGALRFHGSLIGPLANRTCPARVEIDGMMYELERNVGDVHLHSGRGATQLQVWDVVDVSETAVTLTCHLVDGQAGLPGNRDITVVFEVSAPATLSMRINGVTDAPTLMNFANHSYWNLDGTATWAGHQLHVHAEHYLPLTENLIPTGEVETVADGSLDFRQAAEISPQNPDFDNNFCLSNQRTALRDVLTLTGTSGVTMTVATDQTGIQVYDNRAPARPGKEVYEGLAIEAQSWPNAPHNSGFPSIRVTPDAPYVQETQWRFSKG